MLLSFAIAGSGLINALQIGDQQYKVTRVR